MATLGLLETSVGNALQEIFTCKDIEPGDPPSYQTCKTLMAYHPLGAKMTDSPVALAQSQRRDITVPKGPEERLVEAYNAEWDALEADKHIFNLARSARGYGISSIALLSEGTPSDRPINFKELYKTRIAFNVFDPLNTAGSLVLNQDPNSLDFQKVIGIAVNGVGYHRSRSVTLQNENPLYIEYTTSAFGFVGRSVFQRALYPMRSFIRSMITDDMVVLKGGVIIAKMKPPGSIANRAMAILAGVKRSLIQEAQTGNVIGIVPEEEIETLNFQNLEGPVAMARKNILDNIATASDMPAILLNQETFAEGFGEGTEDAKRVSQYIARIRVWMGPVYSWMDRIVQHRAWNPDFYRAIQRDFKDYANKPYTQAFYEWQNSFVASWPNLIEEPDSEKIKVDDVKLKAVIAAFQVVEPILDPENKAILVQWLEDCFNDRKVLFPSPLQLDMDSLRNYVPPVPVAGGEEGKMPNAAPPFSGRDSQGVSRAMEALTAAIGELPDLRKRVLPDQRRLVGIK